MMTAIEWTHRSGTTGESWNPITGCTPVSEGCAHCFARRMARRLAGRYGYPEAPHEFDVTLHHDKWKTPLKWRKARTVFVCSMSDLFHEDVDEYFRADLWSVMCATPRHTYIVLTKRAKAMHDWIVDNEMDMPPHIIGMVTAENQARADERIPWLIKTPFAIRGVSVEPMLSRVDASRWLGGEEECYVCGGTGYGIGDTDCPACLGTAYIDKPPMLDWIICGAETGPGAREMDLAWARDLRDQCQEAGVPYFFKRPSPGQDTPPDLMVREWPKEP